MGLIYLLPSCERGKIGCHFGTQSVLAQGHLCPRSSHCPQMKKDQSLPPFCPPTSGSLCRGLKTTGNLTLIFPHSSPNYQALYRSLRKQQKPKREKATTQGRDRSHLSWSLEPLPSQGLGLLSGERGEDSHLPVSPARSTLLHSFCPRKYPPGISEDQVVSPSGSPPGQPP